MNLDSGKGTTADKNNLLTLFVTNFGTDLLREYDTGISKGYAFVTYSAAEEAEEARSNLNGHEIAEGLRLRVEISKRGRPRTPVFKKESHRGKSTGGDHYAPPPKSQKNPPLLGKNKTKGRKRKLETKKNKGGRASKRTPHQQHESAAPASEYMYTPQQNAQPFGYNSYYSNQVGQHAWMHHMTMPPASYTQVPNNRYNGPTQRRADYSQSPFYSPNQNPVGQNAFYQQGVSSYPFMYSQGGQNNQNS
ncbi:hypothetical protein O9G_004337 [Rozella allomycis CSF55]|uniref:RRM domain-containing protein n=1 Tax=Rozella allomycis (strain CSF55) TaxID=988480 RepID=A0A075B5F4_ROZAC|nr:hypothetical protein O9G_004337 [Rozella allomycis CSF55]|eukprot:EPZ37089.1 hypothetical protein O9G_004337 [Rozella allomycis CSF55]